MKITNKIGLSFEFLENGSLKNIEAEKIRINLKPGTLFSKNITNIYLRKKGEKIKFHPLFGAGSNSSFTVENNLYKAKGTWGNIDYNCVLQLAENTFAWKWNVEITNKNAENVELDLVYFQEIGLKTSNDGLVNEYYVSQYLERIVLEDQNHGSVLACRQNTKEVSGYPWLLLASENTANSALTDGMQFYGNLYRATEIPEALLKNSFDGNLAGESPIIALQEKPFSLNFGETKKAAFFGIFNPNHEKATSTDDLEILKNIKTEFSEIEINFNQNEAETFGNIFSDASFLEVNDLDDAEISTYFGNKILHKESQNGKWLSFFTKEQNHVISKFKETLVDRPHAHILQSKMGYNPDENVMSTTCFATGVFNSHISQGNTNFNVFLSINTSQFNTIFESGQRIFVKIKDQNYLLGIPSAFEMGLDFCRWIYKFNEGVFEIVTQSSIENPFFETTFKVLKGEEVQLIFTQDFDKLNSWKISETENKNVFVANPSEKSMIKEKFENPQFKVEVKTENVSYKSTLETEISENLKGLQNHLFALETEKTKEFTVRFVGEVLQKMNEENFHSKSGQNFWKSLGNNLKLQSENNHIKAIDTILPWYGMNAMTHYLTPYGLEQFSGAAWGTRDVSQGPIEFLLSLEKFDSAKEVLKIIFKNQNTFGDWPQWWMFDSYSQVRAGDCHGDIYYWVLISLANYIKTTGDFGVLDEKLPYFDNKTETTVAEHAERLIKMIVDSYIGETALVPFGGGDWNDSLQPLSEELAKRLISSWTVEMNYQAFSEMKEIYEMMGNSTKSEELQNYLDRIKADFNQFLVKDGVVAGYGYVEDDGNISVLLHPTDKKTGIKYSLLPMNRGIISGIFTKEQALAHQPIIDQYLKGPDGARLMDKPLKYKGGIQEIFQRAESSTYFGREIGLMYIHEHVRYAESQAMLGKAEEFVKAMRQAIPVNYQEIVSQGSLRQANCYYSSSDVAFKTRYEADEKYQDVLDGKMRVDGGWRVYSSGPGIYISLVIKKLMGFRADKDFVVIDPVLTKEMNGLKASINYHNYFLNFEYEVKEGNFNPKKITINGSEVAFAEEENILRKGGAKMQKSVFLQLLKEGENTILVEL